MREFDQNFTVKQFGYKDLEDYYSNATLHNKLHSIEVPILCLSAADDPFQPLEGNLNPPNLPIKRTITGHYMPKFRHSAMKAKAM